MQIYDKTGYCNISEIVDQNMPFTFVVGGRGTGKTYGALKYVLENKIEFILMRRTQSQIDIIGRQEFSPFKALEDDLGIEVVCKSIAKNVSGFYVDDELIGSAVALSTFSNLRGFSSKAKILIYDEFIPERHERPIKEEGGAFFNVIETINRNRELKGEPPIQVLCLANSNDIGNPVFMEFNLIKTAESLNQNKRPYYLNRDKGILLVNLVDSPISAKKRETALYKAVGESQHKRMALDNDYIDDSIAQIKSLNLKEYIPILSIADCCFYKHKSEKRYYMSEHITGSPDRLTTASADIEQFRKKYYYLYSAYLGRRITFENKLCAVLFEKLW